MPFFVVVFTFLCVNQTKEDSKKKLSWDVHFWLGLETSQDEGNVIQIDLRIFNVIL